MKIVEILRIFKEELNADKDYASVLERVRIRLSLEIAERVIKPVVSAERLELFCNLIKGKTLWLKIGQCPDGSSIAVDVDDFSRAYHALEKAYSTLLDNYADTPEYFRKAWPHEVLVEGLCSASVECEMALEELKSSGVTHSYHTKALVFIEIFQWMQIGLVSEDTMDEYSRELNGALAIIRSFF